MAELIVQSVHICCCSCQAATPEQSLRLQFKEAPRWGPGASIHLQGAHGFILSVSMWSGLLIGPEDEHQ